MKSVLTYGPANPGVLWLEFLLGRYSETGVAPGLLAKQFVLVATRGDRGS